MSSFQAEPTCGRKPSQLLVHTTFSKSESPHLVCVSCYATKVARYGTVRSRVYIRTLALRDVCEEVWIREYDAGVRVWPRETTVRQYGTVHMVNASRAKRCWHGSLRWAIPARPVFTIFQSEPTGACRRGCVNGL